MEKIIEYFAANPVHLAIALVLAFVVLFSFVKKLLKLGLVIIAIFIIYIAFLVYTGQEFNPDQFDEVGKKAKEMINESKESIELERWITTEHDDNPDNDDESTLNEGKSGENREENETEGEEINEGEKNNDQENEIMNYIFQKPK